MIILRDAFAPAPPGLDYWRYCGLDGIGTRQAFDVLYPQLDESEQKFYRAAFAFQSFALAMTLRGTLVDQEARKKAIAALREEINSDIQKLNNHPTLEERWTDLGPRPPGSKCAQGPTPRHNWAPRGNAADRQTCSYCGEARLVRKLFNPNSSAQCISLLYGRIGLQERHSRKGDRNVTADDEALDALANKYAEHSELIDRIRDIRGKIKQLGELSARLDPDGRWRASFNICAAETDRQSSSKSPRYTGNNMQNIADQSRNIFIPDPGLELWYADLEQAESRIVAHVARCPQDIADHNGGDTHTGLAVDIFPGLPWSSVGTLGTCPLCTGRAEGPRSNCKLCGGSGKALRQLTLKDIAGTPLPWDPLHDYRHVAKIVRHGTNIGMTHVGISRQLHVGRQEAQKYRDAYFERYPENAALQRELRRQIRTQGVVTNPLGRTRRFMGRLWEDDTQKEGLAQIQQSTVAWMVNLAGWRVWYEMDTRLNVGSAPKASDPNQVWLLGQIHDALLGLRRPGDDAAMRRVRDIMETPVLIHGEPVTIPCEILIGKTWRKEDMVKWHG